MSPHKAERASLGDCEGLLSAALLFAMSPSAQDCLSRGLREWLSGTLSKLHSRQMSGAPECPLALLGFRREMKGDRRHLPIFYISLWGEGVRWIELPCILPG